MEKTQKLPKLTKKQSGFVKDYVLSGNGEQAALNNYHIKSKDKKNIARSIASQNLTKLNVATAIEIKQETLKSALEKRGVTPEKIAEKVSVLLEAKIERRNESGEVVESFTDFNAVDKGLKHATNIYGVEDQGDKPKLGNTYNFIFSKEVQDKVKLIEANIKEILIKPNVQES